MIIQIEMDIDDVKDRLHEGGGELRLDFNEIAYRHEHDAQCKDPWHKLSEKKKSFTLGCPQEKAIGYGVRRSFKIIKIEGKC